jgi:4-hydroxy-tetrahydrodipicolinate synthase
MISPQPTARARIRGVLAPVLTPFTADLRPDIQRFVEHARWLTQSGAGLAIFGTNSEAASLTVEERIELTDALLAAGIPASRMMPGTGNCALGDTVRLTTHAVRNGAAGVLMLPPFYYKGLSEDGLFAYFSEVIERVGDERLAVYLYHIPQVSGVPIPIGLIERLLKRYPRIVAGAKDSSGDWHNTEQMIQLFANDGFDVFPASETLLSKALAIGGAGCISATVNINPAAIHALYAATPSDRAALQFRADTVRHILQTMAMIPAMKFVLAEFTGHRSWSVVRPPLVALDGSEGRRLIQALLDVDFRMPGVPTAGKKTVLAEA